jgi:hypothetical protein
MSVIQFQMNEEQRNLPIVFTVEMCSTRGVQILLHCKYTGETLYGIAYTWFNVPHAVYRWQWVPITCDPTGFSPIRRRV